MSTGILKALMQLFAIIAGADKSTGREIVATFLRQQLNQDLVNEYLKNFEDFAENFYAGNNSEEKRTSVASVKVLRICHQINEELPQKDKLIVLIRLLEFVEILNKEDAQKKEFVQTVSEAFHISGTIFQQLSLLVHANHSDEIAGDAFLLAGCTKNEAENTRFLTVCELRGKLVFLRLADENLFFIRYFGQDELFLNSQQIIRGKTYVFAQGATIRNSRINPVFYSDVLHKYLADETGFHIVFQAENISYDFPSGKQALHQTFLSEKNGNLVGIMGGSGAGKSTFLNILNGNIAPSFGNVTINGMDIYGKNSPVRSLLGYVAQDDLLIEELTVFQNLYYNARLCFRDMSDEALTDRVNTTLHAIGLYEAKDLRVGSVLDKTISGGQRKRLNIALELIREPVVLFVDEPTSGLSSRDSENIMDLLKELTLRGKLIFAVIHQPGSDIFKMLDKLFILDQGGYPIYYGNPVESIIYFKQMANQTNLTESECPHCGNVNPEQIFNIIEAKVVDEYGNETEHRKISPTEWNNFYNVFLANRIVSKSEVKESPMSTSRLPGALAQWKVFVLRDALSKWVNRQYMLINFLEAPVLAFVLSLFIKYYPSGNGLSPHYTFRESINFPQYLFISVVVSLFLGLTVSAEEIIKDQKILKREKYLRLNRSSYLFSKIGILFFISMIQSLSFVWVGNAVLEVKGMLLPFWLVLFSTSCFANVLGLNISTSFNSAKVIYIIIPILIIPQLLFSGVIVRFDRLWPTLSSQKSVPWIGNIMTSRWAYEALAVYQFKNNAFEKNFFEFEKQRKYYNWKKDYWIKELYATINEVRKEKDNPEHVKSLAYHLRLLQTELIKETKSVPGFSFPEVKMFTPTEVTDDVLIQAEDQLSLLNDYYIKNYNLVNRERERKISEMTATPELRDQYLQLQDDYFNESLEDFVTQKNDIKKIVEYDGELIQKQNLIFIPPQGGFFAAHFYAPSKKLLGMQLTTLSANTLVIWAMTLFFTIVLFFDGLRKCLSLLRPPFFTPA